MGPLDVADIEAKGVWITNPPGSQGLGGRQGHTAPRNYLKPGANEGCLLVELFSTIGGHPDSVIAFSRDDEVLKGIKGPLATMVFVANDDPNPQPPGAGFNDNSGQLTVYVTISSS
jgi:hypothetical protein